MFYFKEFLLEFVLQQMYIIYLNLIIDEKAKSKCQLPIHSQKKISSPLGGEIIFYIIYIYAIYVIVLFFFSKILFISCISQDLLG